MRRSVPPERCLLVGWSLVIVASVFAVSSSTTTQVTVFVLAVPVPGARRLIHFFPDDGIKVFGYAAGSAFGAFVLVKIFPYVLRQKTATSDTIFAALSVYLLFGLGWGMVYAIVQQPSPGAFAFPATELSAGLLRELVYFSLTILTTVGYGDTTPMSPVAQGFSNLEAVLGQIYPALLVARLVGIQVAQSTRAKSPD